MKLQDIEYMVIWTVNDWETSNEQAFDDADKAREYIGNVYADAAEFGLDLHLYIEKTCVMNTLAFLDGNNTELAGYTRDLSR